uniref:Uncharacterized protein n=3 Tax=unclassified bacterial viruses TaxID=12333 RepID=A0AAU6W0Z6_9VIRU
MVHTKRYANVWYTQVHQVVPLVRVFNTFGEAQQHHEDNKKFGYNFVAIGTVTYTEDKQDAN